MKHFIPNTTKNLAQKKVKLNVFKSGLKPRKRSLRESFNLDMTERRGGCQLENLGLSRAFLVQKRDGGAMGVKKKRNLALFHVETCPSEW